MILYSTIVGSTTHSAAPPPDQAASVGLTPVPGISLQADDVQEGFEELQMEINANDIDIITLNNAASLAVAKFNNALI